jgi:hypothetical protein
MTNPNGDISVSQQFVQVYEAFTGANVGGTSIPANAAQQTSAQKQFISRLEAFDATISGAGTLSTNSADINEWYNFASNLHFNPTFNPSIQPTPDTTIVLNQVLSTLISMIGVVESVTAAQSNQLNFYATWQDSYTNVLNQVHIFATGDGTSLQGATAAAGTIASPSDWQDTTSSTPLSNARSNLNAVDQNFITNLQGEQSNVSNSSKAIQTDVNQSSNEASQESTVANSILQEMSTIVTSIFQTSS